MSPEPSGEVERTAGGRDLILRRDLPLEPDQAWAWITESGKTGQWFGTWTGAVRAPALGAPCPTADPRGFPTPISSRT